MPYTRSIGEIQTRKGTKGSTYKFLHIDEANLDIFDQFDQSVIPDWKPDPARRLKSFNEVSAVYFDLETTGFNPEKEEIILCGCRNESSRNVIFGRETLSEIQIIKSFFLLLEKKMPVFIAGFNNIFFDINFLIKRCELLRIKHPFKVNSEKIVTVSTAQKNGSPQKYPSVECWINGKQIHILDLYHLVLSWDFVAHKLTSHTLKQSVLQIGLRKEARLELSYSQMMQVWHGFLAGKNDLSKLKEYLIFDLEDTHILGQFLIPDIYNQLLFLPNWKLQTLATAGNATKWNSFLIDGYQGDYNWNTRTVTIQHNYQSLVIEPDHPIKFEGGYTEGKAGIFPCSAKIDVSSLYPAVMLGYGVYSHKDLNLQFLARLKYFRQVRLGYKVLKTWLSGDEVNLIDQIEAIKKSISFSIAIGFDDRLLTDLLKSIVLNDLDDVKKILESLPKAFFKSEGSLKVFINSGYGSFGATGIAFNDYHAAATVTAYGRAIVKFMRDYINTHGGKSFEVDTDGIFFNSDSAEKNIEIFKGLQEELPECINIELEINKKLIFIPPVDPKKLASERRKGKEVDEAEGLKKNYILINPDGSIFKTSGKYRKRDRCQLEKEFQPTFLSILQRDGLESAKVYYNALLKEIQSGCLDVSKIVVTRKARVNERGVFERQLVDADGITSYYVVDEEKQLKTKTKIIAGKANTGDYSIDFYMKMIRNQYAEMEPYL